MHKILSYHQESKVEYLLIGQGIWSENPLAIHTVLGSCVSVTFFSSKCKVGGIFHALLPAWRKHEKGNTPLNPFKYVDSAIDHFYNLIQKDRHKLGNIQCKVFGGGGALLNGEVGTGRKNVQVAFEKLAGYKMRVLASDVGGGAGRKLIFFTHTGEVFVKQLNK